MLYPLKAVNIAFIYNFTARDDKDAIDQSNIIEDRTRGATAKQGTYREPGDEEGLGGNDGRSVVEGGPN